MARVLTGVDAVRARFTALQRDLAFFDGPGGTQVPDSVIDAIGDCLRESNANLGGPFETSRRADELVALAHDTAAGFLNATAGEVAFGQNMTTLNFALSRAASREWHTGDEVVCTQLDHDANVSPWLELAHDKGLRVRLARVDDECRLDLDHLRSLVGERTRVIAFPWAANAVGTVTPVAEIVRIAHEAGALAWVDAVHYGPHGPIDVQAADVDVLLCSPYKFYGPHLGLAYVKGEVGESWRPYKVRPADGRFETGTLAHELLAGFVAAVTYLEDVGWHFVTGHERELGQRFLDNLPEEWALHGIPSMEGRVPTFAVTHGRIGPEEAATRLGERGLAVWNGDYYAVEIMKRLGLPDGAVRVGIVHYNTAGEVDRLLAALAEV
ncbi:MAG TPA: cysteine desulfurase-like protein [Gaiellaceae bacterium]|nr:cysteine desulfurase-like protein [Gaiellaceae bacterium]